MKGIFSSVACEAPPPPSSSRFFSACVCVGGGGGGGIHTCEHVWTGVCTGFACESLVVADFLPAFPFQLSSFFYSISKAIYFILTSFTLFLV